MVRLRRSNTPIAICRAFIPCLRPTAVRNGDEGIYPAEKPKGIINIVDASNIERNLYLTMQLMELDVPMVVAEYADDG